LSLERVSVGGGRLQRGFGVRRPTRHHVQSRQGAIGLDVRRFASHRGLHGRFRFGVTAHAPVEVSERELRSGVIGSGQNRGLFKRRLGFLRASSRKLQRAQVGIVQRPRGIQLQRLLHVLDRGVDVPEACRRISPEHLGLEAARIPGEHPLGPRACIFILACLQERVSGVQLRRLVVRQQIRRPDKFTPGRVRRSDQLICLRELLSGDPRARVMRDRGAILDDRPFVVFFVE
jgi:hypothetical protein